VNAVRPLARSNRRLIFDNDSVGSLAESIANTGKGIVVHQSGDVTLLQPVAQPR
jgi:hypothetical protein